jgi:hypothetical protein
MNLIELAENVGAKVVNTECCQREAEYVYAGDRVSDLLEHASNNTLIVSNLASGQLMRIAELMEVAGICLVNSHQPAKEDLQFMSEHGIAVLVSPVGLFETCGRAYKCLFDKTRI